MRITDNIRTPVFQMRSAGAGQSSLAQAFAKAYADALNNRESNHEATASADSRLNENIHIGRLATAADIEFYDPGEQPELLVNTYPGPTYPESIYDVPVSEWSMWLNEAMSAGCTINTAGMTKGEIYNAVKSKFTDYFGPDFLEPHYTRSAHGSELSDIGWTMAQHIHVVFNKTLNHCGVDEHDSSIHIEAAGYTGMSKEEIKADVRAKYPEVMTLGQCKVMGWELYKLGVTKRNYGNITEYGPLGSAITMLFPESPEKMKKLYEMMLSFPADFDKMTSEIDLREKDMVMYNVKLDAMDPVTMLLSTFRASGNGLYTADMINRLVRLLGSS